MSRDQDMAGDACASGPDQVPSCDTGPGGRVAFVARELADLWRELRGSASGKARPTPDPSTGTDGDVEK